MAVSRPLDPGEGWGARLRSYPVRPTPWTCDGVPGEGSIPVPLPPQKEIQTRSNFRAHKWLSKLIFLNYTKMTKYEALEKNAVSNRKMRLLTNLRYRQSQVNGSVFGAFPVLKARAFYQTTGALAERVSDQLSVSAVRHLPLASR